MIKIFIVSLKGSPRRSKITADLEAEHLPFEFFDAVDARAGVPLKYQKRINRTLANIRLLRKVVYGEFGVALSYALLYEKIVRENISDVIILEDDAILTADFFKLVKSGALEKSDIDMAFLFHSDCMAYHKKYYFEGFEYRKIHCMPFGAVAYYINLSVAKYLYENTKIIDYVADFPAPVHLYFNTIAFHPRLVKHPPLSEEQTTIKNRYKCNKKINYYIRKVFIEYAFPFYCYFYYYLFLRKVYRSFFGYLKKVFYSYFIRFKIMEHIS